MGDIRVSSELSRVLIKLATSTNKLNMSEAYIDTKYGHIWESDTADSCVCGLVRETLTDEGEQENAVTRRLKANCLELVINSTNSLNNSCKLIQPSLQIKQAGLLLDNYHWKVASLLSSLELASSLANIGLVIAC